MSDDEIESKPDVDGFRKAVGDHVMISNVFSAASAGWLSNSNTRPRERDGCSLATLSWIRLEATLSGMIRIGHTWDHCDSPIETKFNRFTLRFLSDRTRVCRQHRIRTGKGLKRVDFLYVSASGKRIAVECDGKDWHCASVDSVRDNAILETGEVDRIIRFRGCDIWHREVDVSWLLSITAPELFWGGGLLHARCRADTDTGRQATTQRLHGYTAITVDQCVGMDDDENRPFHPGCQVMYMDRTSANESRSTDPNQKGQSPVLSRGHTQNLLVPANGHKGLGCELEEEGEEME